MKKRIISLLLCFVMLFTLFSVQAFAADQVRIEGENVTHKLNVGDVVEVPVNVTENPGFIIGKIRVSWDSTALKLTEVSYNGFVPSEMPAPITEGISSYAVPFGKSDATANYTQTGLLFTLKYEVLAGAAAKEYPITLTTENTFFQNFDVDDVASVTTNGSVTLTAPAPTTCTVTITPGANMTLKSGNTNQTIPKNNIISPIYFTADEGYYFPDDYTVTEQNGVGVEWVSKDEIKVTSTVVTGNVNITLPDATEKPAAATYTVKVNGGTGVSANWTQTVNDGVAITAKEFEASNNYYFPVGYGENLGGSGIVVTRNSFSKITVSGTPTADVTIDLPAATEKDTQEPPVVGHTDCTAAGVNDGTITGLTAFMQWKMGDTGDNWNNVSSSETELTGRAPGTYYVRYKATDTKKASEPATVVINAYDPTVVKFTVTYNANGGNGNDFSEQVTKGTDYVIKGADACGFTAQDGMRFVYWSNTADNGQGSEHYPAGYEYRNLQSNLTLYAVWETTARTVQFDANGGTGTMNAVTATYGEQYTLPPCTFTAPEGKEFDCWKPDVGQGTYKPGDSYPITGNVKFVAQWKVKQGGGEQPTTFTLTFKPGEGGGRDYMAAGIDAQYNLPNPGDIGITPPNNKPIFDGWKDENNNVYPAGKDVPVNADATYVAQWKADGPQGDKVLVTFKPGDGKGDAIEERVPAGDSYRLPAKPAGFKAPAGKVFAGWKIEDPQGNLNEKLYKAGHKFDLTEDVTFVAQWKTRPYYGDDTTPDTDPMVNPGTGAAPVGAPIAVVIAVAVAGAAYFVTTKKR